MQKSKNSSQSARQEDGSSPLQVVGETRLTFSRDSHGLHFEGLVVEDLDTEILAGIHFMERNDISIRPAHRLLSIKNVNYAYGSSDSLKHQSLICASCSRLHFVARGLY